MKKRLITSALTLALIAQMGVVALAAPVEQSQHEGASFSQVNPKADQIVWYRRIYNGQEQRRAWNATKGYWIGEWTNV